MKRLIGCMAVLCLLALAGCGGAQKSGTLAYVSNSLGTGFTVFNINTNGTLTTSSISPQNTPAAPKVMKIAPNGKWVFFLDAGGSNIYVFTRSGNGALATLVDHYPVVGNASSLVVSSNSQFLFVSLPGALTGELAIYSIDQLTGILTQVGSNQLIGYSITQLEISPSGGILYALAPAQQAVLTFTVDSATGLITGPNTFPVGPAPPCSDYLTNPAHQKGCGGMILSANGSFLYVLDTTATSSFTTNGSFNGTGISFTGQSANIYAFTTQTNGILQAINGSPFNENADLSQLAKTPPALPEYPTNPVAGATSSDSRFLFIANQGTHNLSVFKVNTTSGELTQDIPSVTSVSGITSSNTSPFDCGVGCKAPDFIAAAKNNSMYVLDTSAGMTFQFHVDLNRGTLRALSPASVATAAGGSPVWITIR